jgi:hypothetical protein
MLTPSQQRIVGMALAARSAEPADAVVKTVPLTQRKLAFLIDALDVFHDVACPQHGGTNGCQLLEWGENPATGAIDTSCSEACVAWRDELIASVAPAHSVASGNARLEAMRAPAVSLPPADPGRFIPAD